jgi:hypothetical protein
MTPFNLVGIKTKEKHSLSASRYISIGIATRDEMEVPGIESGWGENFRTCPDLPWGPPVQTCPGAHLSRPALGPTCPDLSWGPPVQTCPGAHLSRPALGPTRPDLPWGPPVQTCSGAHLSRPALGPTRPDPPWGPPILLHNSYQFSFLGLKRSRRGVDHSPHLLPKLKKEYSYTSTPPLRLRGLL